ncbi:unnamed protein product [Anisakis simplex]|uniref:Uncharacterized protein n=1 Tax=Anisakis simplex TaxID=6269 RepID=A0A0M3K192_ANISI|nr:unnamed protein product [Anisakis simplex]
MHTLNTVVFYGNGTLCKRCPPTDQERLAISSIMEGFKYLRTKFSSSKEEILIGLQICLLLKNGDLESAPHGEEKDAWEAFKMFQPWKGAIGVNGVQSRSQTTAGLRPEMFLQPNKSV